MHLLGFLGCLGKRPTIVFLALHRTRTKTGVVRGSWRPPVLASAERLLGPLPLWSWRVRRRIERGGLVVRGSRRLVGWLKEVGRRADHTRKQLGSSSRNHHYHPQQSRRHTSALEEIESLRSSIRVWRQPPAWAPHCPQRARLPVPAWGVPVAVTSPVVDTAGRAPEGFSP